MFKKPPDLWKRVVAMLISHEAADWSHRVGLVSGHSTLRVDGDSTLLHLMGVVAAAGGKEFGS